jgi:hypothetical protein
VIGDVVAMGGDVTVAGHVEGDVASMGGDVYLKSSARVDGDVVCMGGQLHEDSGATVGGQRVSGLGRHGTYRVRETHPRYDGGSRLAGSIVWLLLVLGIAWAFARLAPGRTAAVVDTLRREPVTSLGIGALVFALIVPSIVVVAILCITIIGIPFAIAALFAYMIFLLLLWGWGYIAACTALGFVLLGRLGTSSPAPAVAGMPVAPAPPPSLVRAAVVGVLAITGSAVVGRMLQSLGIGPLHGLGTLIRVLAMIACIVAVTFGSGAWIRTELRAGTIAGWWRGRQWGRGTPASATTPAGGGPATGTVEATGYAAPPPYASAPPPEGAYGPPAGSPYSPPPPPMPPPPEPPAGSIG